MRGQRDVIFKGFPRTGELNFSCGDFGANGGAEIVGERADKGFVAFAEALKGGRVARLGLGFCGAEHATDYAARVALGFVELGKGGAEAEFFGVSGVDARDERADELVEEFGGEFAADEGGDGLVGVGRSAAAEEIAEDATFCADAEEGRAEESGWA